MKTPKTNEQALRSLIKRLDKENSIYSAMLRERILHIMDLTKKSINENPQEWRNGLIGINFYNDLIRIVYEELGLD